jgi:hypothetical protein
MRNTIPMAILKQIYRCLFVFVACCLLAPAYCFSQSIDELIEKSKSASADDKPAILNQIAEAYLKTDANKAIDYGEQALKAARKVEDVDAETGALINLGDANKF